MFWGQVLFGFLSNYEHVNVLSLHPYTFTLLQRLCAVPDIRAGALFFPHVLYSLIDTRIRLACFGGLQKSRGEGFGKLK